MNHFKNWFCRVLEVGIAVNLALAVPVLIAPAWTLSLVSIPPPEPLLYARFAGLLVILLSMAYLPAALDPDRYRAVAWFAVLSRAAAATFFVTTAICLDERVFYLPALVDVTFLLAQSVPLVLGVKLERRPQAARGWCGGDGGPS
jgi:hypothetical protein